MSGFDDTLERHFPGAVPSGVFLNQVWTSTEELGFKVGNTLPLISICRDELTTDFFARIQAIWGPAFTLAGLGGVPALGRTGWGAAFSHIPDDASLFMNIGTTIEAVARALCNTHKHLRIVTNCINVATVLTRRQDFEIIITDDGSSDNTVEKIRAFQDSRIQLSIFKENLGAAIATNHDHTHHLPQHGVNLLPVLA